MDKDTTLELVVEGPYALFSNPIFRVGGEKVSYAIPTYAAMVGILKSVYWKPTFTWVIDEVRIMNRIRTEAKGIRKLMWHKPTADLSKNRYLKDVRYQVRAHIEWNRNHPELDDDRSYAKHMAIARRALERGGRRDVWLGTRECQAYVSPCVFGEGPGYYDNAGVEVYDPMYHGYTYPDESYSKDTAGYLTERYWIPDVVDGVIRYCRPEQCPIQRPIREMTAKTFGGRGDG